MPPQTSPKFSRLQLVRLRHDPERMGPVWSEPISSENEWLYRVFFGARDQPIVPESDLVASVPDINVGDHESFLRHLVLYKLRKPLANNVYSLYASRTQFEPYQFKPVLKFLNNPDQRLLIADEVGLGKTIEAGIIMLELQARLNGLPRVLVVCPSALRAKWQFELRSRFDEVFTLLDAEGMRRFLENYRLFGEAQALKGIVSIELMRRDEFTAALAEMRVAFDLVIIDEAHHCRNTGTQNNNMASVLSDNADAMLLLTATPLHLGNADLLHLLQILAPGDFDNVSAFETTLEPNVYLNNTVRLILQDKPREARESLRRVEKSLLRERFARNPYYADLLHLLEKSSLTSAEKVAAQQRLLELNTLSHIFTRTRKREVIQASTPRDAKVLRVEFTQEERRFYDQVIAQVRNEFASRQRKGWGATFAVIMRERQAASCISALRERLEEELNTVHISVEDEYLAQELGADEIEAIPTSRTSVVGLLGAAPTASSIDSKFDKFLFGLREVLAENSKSKILVFSFFKGTLEYLYRRLNQLGFGVLMMHGGINVADRQTIVEQFRDDPRINILLSSEVGAEGLDFQFSDTLFNYDLPWNPMRVEQRIGRLDRFGQTAPKIRIYNLVIANSIEERIYYRLYQRIHVFEQSIGDLEVILGEELRELSRQVFTRQLTPQQEQALADQTALAIERRKNVQDQLEARKHELMGQDQIMENDLKRTVESGRFVSEVELQVLVETFLKANFRRTKLYRNQDDPTFVLECGDDFFTHMQTFLLNSRPQDPSAMTFLARCRTGQRLPLTFRAQTAYERKPLEFITLRHPLVQTAAAHWQTADNVDLPLCEIRLKTSRVAQGKYYFMVFAYATTGIKNETIVSPIAISVDTSQPSTELSQSLLHLVQQPGVLKASAGDDFDMEVFERMRQIAEGSAAERLSRIKADALRVNDALVAARRAAIDQTYTLKKQKLERFYTEANNPNIKRMRAAQLRNHEAWYSAAKSKLAEQTHVRVTLEPVLGGLAHLLP